MDKFEHDAWVKEILQESYSEYLDLQLQNHSHIKDKVNRLGEKIDYATWFILIGVEEYCKVRMDLFEDYEVLTQWDGFESHPFEVKVYISGHKIDGQSADSEDIALRAHEKFLFYIDQKIYNYS